jgi:hypothetical protein
LELAVSDRQTHDLIRDILRNFAARERNQVENVIAAVTDADLVTAVRPFMFGGRIVHELYFDRSKLLFFTMEEKIGGAVSALIIAYLAHKKVVPLSDQALMNHSKLVFREAKRLHYASQVSAFLQSQNPRR